MPSFCTNLRLIYSASLFNNNRCPVHIHPINQWVFKLSVRSLVREVSRFLTQFHETLRCDWSCFRKIYGPKNFFVTRIRVRFPGRDDGCAKTLQKMQTIPKWPCHSQSLLGDSTVQSPKEPQCRPSTAPVWRLLNHVFSKIPGWGQEVRPGTKGNVPGKTAVFWEQNVSVAQRSHCSTASRKTAASFLGSCDNLPDQAHFRNRALWGFIMSNIL